MAPHPHPLRRLACVDQLRAAARETVAALDPAHRLALCRACLAGRLGGDPDTRLLVGCLAFLAVEDLQATEDDC